MIWNFVVQKLHSIRRTQFKIIKAIVSAYWYSVLQQITSIVDKYHA